MIKEMKQTIVLVVLDGWGIGERNQSNPIYTAQPKTIEYIKNNFPSGALQASGIAVGLPWGEEGNSEVGHLTMGIGKIIYQHYPRISLSIRDGSFSQNETVIRALDHAKERQSRIHFAGLISAANIHSSLEHLAALIAMAKEKEVPFFIHAFTDGRDSDPHSAYELLKKISPESLGSVSGRYYAMDRDKHYDLTEKAYRAITGEAPVILHKNLEKHIRDTYQKNLNDEFIAPAIIESADRSLKDGDAIFFFNFREDRVRQLAESFIQPDFSHFPVKNFSDIFISSMTSPREDLKIPVAFPPQKITASVGQIISENNKTQLRIAETQKYAHVTFFFNGLNDASFKNEYRVLIPSRTVPRQEEDPVMMAPAITTRLLQAIEESSFDFVLVNYANPDMVAHTGNIDATKKAVEVIDEQLAKIVPAVLTSNTILLITSDHGNAEKLFNPLTGEPETKHDISPVPVYLVGKQYEKPRDRFRVQDQERAPIGMLADIGPTVLELLEIPKDPEMAGESLLRQLLS